MDTEGIITPQQCTALTHYLKQNDYYERYEEITYYYQGPYKWTDPASLTQIETQTLEHGYGYDTSTVTVRLSIVVVTAYILAIVAYLLYTLITGTTATSWDTVAELVTLALHSKRPESLRGTSVGIDTLQTFRQPLNIRVNREDELEIVFSDEKEQLLGRYTNVVPNAKY